MRKQADLFPHQQLAVMRATSSRHCALLLDVGYGKTATSLTALAGLKTFPALVVAPAGVVETNVWGAEAGKWEHLQGMTVRALAGTPAQRLEALQHGAEVEIISYENLLWLTEELDLRKRYKTLIYDELSKMKTPGTKRFKRMRHRAQAGEFGLTLGLTGTPVGNHLLDLWGEMYSVAGPAPLGPTFGAYKDAYFQPADYQGRSWKLKCCPKCSRGLGRCSAAWNHCACHKAAELDIRNRIAPHAYAPKPGLRASLGIPEVRMNPIRVAMPKGCRELSEKLVAELWADLPSGTELEALSASAVAGKLRQLAGGAVYTDKEGKWEAVHDAKLQALDNLLDEQQGQPVILFYWYEHEYMRIVEALKGRRWAGFSASAVERWNAGELDVFLLHPQSAGHGLNLQAGGHHVVWYSLPWSHELWTQGNGRLARPGQQASEVVAHQLLCGPADDRVSTALVNKGRVERDLVNGLGEL